MPPGGQSPGRDGRTHLPSLPGLSSFQGMRFPALKCWAIVGTLPNPAVVRQPDGQGLEPVMHFESDVAPRAKGPAQASPAMLHRGPKALHKPAQGKRGASAALGILEKRNNALKGLRMVSRPFRALFISFILNPAMKILTQRRQDAKAQRSGGSR